MRGLNVDYSTARKLMRVCIYSFERLCVCVMLSAAMKYIYIYCVMECLGERGRKEE